MQFMLAETLGWNTKSSQHALPVPVMIYDTDTVGTAIPEVEDSFGIARVTVINPTIPINIIKPSHYLFPDLSSVGLVQLR